MLLSERKAIGFLKPWWDVVYFYCLILQIAICGALFFTTSSNDKQTIVEATHIVQSGSDNTSALNGSAVDIASVLTKAAANPGQDSSSSSSSSSAYSSRTVTTDSVSAGPFSQVFVLLALVASGCLGLADAIYSRLFYSHVFVQTLCHVLEHVSCNAEQRRYSIAFSGTLHHANDRSSLRTLFDVHNGCRLAVELVLLVVAMHGLISAQEGNVTKTNFALGILLNLLLWLQLFLLSWATLWPWLNTRSLWGKLMKAYSVTTDKLDVVRGRSVPSPKKKKSSALHGVGGGGGGAGGGASQIKYKAHRVLGSLNPYSASENIRLVLDLVASKSGLGLAFKCLAAIEVDVQANWRPQKLRFGFREDTDELELEWVDPLAVVYLSPVPKQLQLHYGININFSSSCPCPDDIVAVVGYDESRFYQQVWRSSRPGKVHLKMSDAAVTYTETFPDIPKQVYGAQVEVWTIVDGHLVAKAGEFKYIREDYANSCSDSDCCTTRGKGAPPPQQTQQQPPPAGHPPRVMLTMASETSIRRGERRDSGEDDAVIVGEMKRVVNEREVRVVDTPPQSSISCTSSLDDLANMEAKGTPSKGKRAAKLESRTRSLTNLVVAKVEKARSLKKSKSHGNKLNKGSVSGTPKKGGSRTGSREVIKQRDRGRARLVEEDSEGEEEEEEYSNGDGYRNYGYDEEDMVI